MALSGYLLLVTIIYVDCNIMVELNPTDYGKEENVTIFNVGVILISKSGTPYDIERSGAAIEMAFEYVNQEILDSSYMIKPVMRKYGPKCDANTAPGRWKFTAQNKS